MTIVNTIRKLLVVIAVINAPKAQGTWEESSTAESKNAKK